MIKATIRPMNKVRSVVTTDEGGELGVSVVSSDP